MTSLFPDFVAVESVEFSDADPARFGEVELPPSLARAVPKRRLEFAAGRFCARIALGRLSPGLRSAALPIGEHRGPVWPEGTVGAITHCQGYAAAAVARLEDAGGIGLDTEELVTGAALEEISTEVATPSELRGLEHRGLDRAQVVTLVLSTKESIFKCLYPQVGRYFGFHGVTLEELDQPSHRFTARLATSLGPIQSGTRVEGRFAFAGSRVHTGLVVGRRGTPA